MTMLLLTTAVADSGANGLVLAVLALPERIVLVFRSFTIIGCFAIALYALVLAAKVTRGTKLADKAQKAERRRREEWRTRMQPRYTPQDMRAQRQPQYRRRDLRS